MSCRQESSYCMITVKKKCLEDERNISKHIPMKKNTQIVNLLDRKELWLFPPFLIMKIQNLPD